MAVLFVKLKSGAECLKAAAIVGVGSGVMFAVGVSPAAAQNVSSSIQFSTIDGTVQNLSPASGANQGNNAGEFTFNPNGIVPGFLGPNNRAGDFFLGIIGLRFVDPQLPSLVYDRSGNTTTYTLSSFYFLAGLNSACSICGPSFAFSPVSTTVGNTSITNPSGGRLLNVSAGPASFDFGGGHSGTISFSAESLTRFNQSPEFRFGDVSFNVIDQPNQVPGPLPLLGAATAFGFSRRLRKRVAAARTAL